MDGTAFRLLGKGLMDVSALPARSPATTAASDKGRVTAAPPTVVDSANLDKPAQKTSESATATPTTGRALEVLR